MLLWCYFISVVGCWIHHEVTTLLKICSAPAVVLEHMFKVRLLIWTRNISLCRSAIFEDDTALNVRVG